jgi:ubiquinone/menaquinone biosynthesis C-methylase UbiE
MQKALGYVNAAYLQQTAAVLADIKKASYSLLNATSHTRVLDVGCGPGIDTHAISEMTGATVVGVDYDQEMACQATARARTVSNCRRPGHAVAVAENLTFADETFDAARCERLLQHVRDPARVVQELARVVHAGGRLVLVDPDFGTLSIDYSGNPAVGRQLQRALAELALANGYSGRQLLRWAH